jgi:hypothetical protein
MPCAMWCLGCWSVGLSLPTLVQGCELDEYGVHLGVWLELLLWQGCFAQSGIVCTVGSAAQQHIV